MNEFYSSSLNRKDLFSKSDGYSGSATKWQAKSIKSMGFAFLFLLSLFGGPDVVAQSILINPATGGGFELGTTFAANGWTESNSVNNPWVIGAAANSGSIAGNSAFISNDGGTSYLYSPANNATNYFYRDVTLPAGETKILLSFDWASKGENSYDLWQVFYAPTTVTPLGVSSHAGSGTSNVPSGILGATYIGNGASVTGVQNASYYLPAALAGTTIRLIFSWKNETGGVQPPAAIDNISLSTSAPGNYVSIASGNFNSPATWSSGMVPTLYDNATIAAGTTVSIDANGKSAKNVTVNGTLDYTATPTSFSIMENLAVGATGIVNVFNGVSGKTLIVSGNIINDGSINLSVGTTSSGNLTLNGTTLQTISGAGSFVSGVIRNLTCSNTSLAIPNIDWQFNNVSVEYNLNISNAKINLGSNTLTHGVSTTIHTTTGAFTSTNGGFTSGIFSRWWSPLATGYTTLGPSSIPTGQGGRYPFVNAAGQHRLLYLGRTSPVDGGQYAVKYTDATTVTSGMSITDATYTVTDRFNGKFQVSTQGTTPSTGSYVVSIFAPEAYVAGSASSRIVGETASISGVNQPTFASAAAQRSAVSEADLLSTSGLYLGIGSTDLIFAPITSGLWSNATTWNRAAVPGCSDAVLINGGHTVTATDAGNISKSITINSNSTLIIASGDLTVGCTANNNPFVNNGTLSVSGGVLNVNGNMLHNSNASFNQSAGAITIDGNDVGLIPTSVASGTAMLQINTSAVSLTGGSLTIVDPHVTATATNTFTYSNIVNIDASAGHTFKLGNGISTDPSGQTNGFRINTYSSSGKFGFGNLEINGGIGTNKAITTTYSFGVNGNLNIIAGALYQEGTSTTYVNGNVTNNGTYLNTGTLYLGSYLGGTAVASTEGQLISGTGIFANLAVDPTANIRNLTINNTNSIGVTFNSPLSISGTLNMISGIANTTATNFLTLGTATATATFSGMPSATTMVNGPFARAIASGNTSFITFPVGKSEYMPIAIAPSTSVISVFKAEAFNANAGTVDASINSLASKRWNVSAISGTYTDIDVKLIDAGISASSIPVLGTAAAGVYSNAFGSIAIYDAGPPPSTESDMPVASADFTGFISYANSNICMGTPVPGNTIASTSTLCNGQSLTLSLENIIAGTGITYLWESSADGVVYAPIIGASDATITLTPSANNFYRAQVTCTTNTGISTPVEVNFTNVISSTTADSICGVGSATLAATPNAGATVSWYANANGGAPISTGTSFTTPSISTTTTFYASAEQSSVTNSAIGLGAATSSTSGSSFLPGAWGGAKTQYIIKGSELTAAGISAGIITSLGFETTSSGQTYQGFTMEIGATSQQLATTTFISGLQQVYKGTLANDGFMPTSAGVNTLAFGTGAGSNTVFNWDGISNIVISISWSSVPTTDTAVSSGMKVDNVGFVSTSYRQRDNLTPAVMLAETSAAGTTLNRPRFTINGFNVCGSPRVPVVATVTVPPAFALDGTSATICNGETTPTAVAITTGASDYDTYVWSPSEGVTGNATSGWMFNPTTTTTYTLTASQSSGVCSNLGTYQVTVNPLPSAVVINASSNLLCIGDAAVKLSVGVTSPMVGGCLTEVNGQYPSSTYTPSVIDGVTVNVATTLGYASEYSVVSVLANINYTFSSSIATDFITISNAAGTVMYAAGQTPVQWTSTNASDVRFYTHANSTCGQQSSSRTRGVIAKIIDLPTWSPVTNLYLDAAATISYVGTSEITVYAKPSSTTTYSAVASTAFGCTLSTDIDITAIDCGIPYANLQFPGNSTIGTCVSPTYYAKVYKVGVTEAPGQGAGITAWIGKSTTNSDPSTWSESSWQLATFNVQDGNDDEYQVTFAPLTDGTYYVASRFIFTPGQYVYGGYTQTGGGIWDGTTNISSVLTVQTAAAPTASAQTFCNSGTVANLIAAGTDLQWYDIATGGTALATSTTLATGDYYVSQTLNSCESLRTLVTVTVNVTAAPIASAQSFCNGLSSATVAALMATGTDLQWYAASTGGTALLSGTALTSGEYYVSQTLNSCESTRTMVAVTINETSAPTASAQVFCNAGTVANLVATGTDLQWYASGFGGDALTSASILVSGDYYVSQTINGCESARTMVAVTVNVTPAPTGTATQDFTMGQTLADFTVIGSDVIWYSDATGTTVLPATTELVSGTTYYASQTVNGCESAIRLAVTAGVDLKTPSFEISNLRYYPNPVQDILTVDYSEAIQGVQLYNMLGQLVYNRNTNASKVTIEMTTMAAGNYILQVTVKGITKNVKVIKN